MYINVSVIDNNFIFYSIIRGWSEFGRLRNAVYLPHKTTQLRAQFKIKTINVHRKFCVRVSVPYIYIYGKGHHTRWRVVVLGLYVHVMTVR